MRSGIVAVLIAAAAVVLPSSALADGPTFGRRGQLVISDDQSFGLIGASGALAPATPGSTSMASAQYATVSDGGGTGGAFVVAPALDFLVIDGLSLGGSLLFGVLSPAHGSGQGVSETLFGIAPRIGYNIPITSVVSFWPKAYFGYTTATASSGNQSASTNQTAVGLYAPFMFHLVPHFFLGLGPNVSTQISNNESPAGGGSNISEPTVTQLGFEVTIGGWMLGAD